MLPASLLNKLPQRAFFFKLSITDICQGTFEHGGVIEKWINYIFFMRFPFISVNFPQYILLNS